VLIQDADLEYDLEDYDALLEQLVAGRCAFVLGSRHGGRNVLKMRQFTGQHGLILFCIHLILTIQSKPVRDWIWRVRIPVGRGVVPRRFDRVHRIIIVIAKGLPAHFRQTSSWGLHCGL